MSKSNLPYNQAWFTRERISAQEKDLGELIIILFKSQHYYSAMAIISELPELKKKFARLAAERKYYAYLLYQNLGMHSRTYVDENGNLVTDILPAYINTAYINCESEADLMCHTIKNEREVIKKYEAYLRNHIPAVAHLKLLVDQKQDIRQTMQSLL